MVLYILDTDHVSLLLQEHSAIQLKIAQLSPDVAITIVTVQELFNGWVARINDPKQADNFVNLYTKLWTTTQFIQEVEVLNFDRAADQQYRRLLRENSALRKNRIQKDLRIASIALSLGATLVTRNHRDFSQVADLKVQDWTRSE